MTRRKPKTFTFLESGHGKKVPGTKGVIVDRANLFAGRMEKKLPELAHRWMSQEKRRTHKRERREGKAETKGQE